MAHHPLCVSFVNALQIKLNKFTTMKQLDKKKEWMYFLNHSAVDSIVDGEYSCCRRKVFDELVCMWYCNAKILCMRGLHDARLTWWSIDGKLIYRSDIKSPYDYSKGIYYEGTWNTQKDEIKKLMIRVNIEKIRKEIALTNLPIP